MGTLESPALLEKLVGPNDVLVGDRIEFDREYFVRPFVCRFEPQA